MARIIIAGATEASRAQLSRLLTSAGYGLFRVCTSGGELRRAMNECDDGVVVIWGALQDCLVDELAEDFEGRFQVLLIGRPEALSVSESPGVFRLALPCSGSAVTGAMEMLLQLHRRGLPRRTDAEKALIERAKRLLMAELGISEPEAHRRMQRYAMRHGIRMTEYAAQVLQGGFDHA